MAATSSYYRRLHHTAISSNLGEPQPLAQRRLAHTREAALGGCALGTAARPTRRRFLRKRLPLDLDPDAAWPEQSGARAARHSGARREQPQTDRSAALST